MNYVQEVSLHIRYLELALVPILILGNCKMEHPVCLFAPGPYLNMSIHLNYEGKWAKLYPTRYRSKLYPG